MTRCPSWSAAGRPRRALNDDEDPPVSYPTASAASTGTADNTSSSTATEPRTNMIARTWGLLRHWGRPLQRANASQEAAQAAGLSGWGLLNWKKCGLSRSASSDRIVGGTAAALGQYPWLARIGYNRKLESCCTESTVPPPAPPPVTSATTQFFVIAAETLRVISHIVVYS